MRTSDQIELKYLSAKQLITTIQDAIEKYGESNVSFDLAIEYSYGSDSPVAYLTCGREMTLLELEAEENARQEREQRNKKYREQQYALLKKEFENK
jgi:hypothetical protein